jgi:hypothetical protein
MKCHKYHESFTIGDLVTFFGLQNCSEEEFVFKTFLICSAFEEFPACFGKCKMYFETSERPKQDLEFWPKMKFRQKFHVRPTLSINELKID